MNTVIMCCLLHHMMSHHNAQCYTHNVPLPPATVSVQLANNTDVGHIHVASLPKHFERTNMYST